MTPGEIVVKGDRLQKLLLFVRAQLIRIPPPAHNDVCDVSRWQLEAIVWSGTLRFVEEERLDGEGSLTGAIELVNPAGELFAVIRYDDNTVQRTPNSRVFRVLIEHEEKMYAFGLVFEDRDAVMEFTMALGDFNRDLLQATEEAHLELMDDLSEHVDRMSVHSDDFGDFVEC